MSFEILVRPLIPPLIRPSPKPPILPFQDTPEQGVAVLRGLSGKLIDLTFSETSSWSKTRMAEKERKFDVERVHQKEEDGTINKENFVEVERLKQLTMQDGMGSEVRYIYLDPTKVYPGHYRDNIEVLETNVTVKNPDVPPVDTGGGVAP